MVFEITDYDLHSGEMPHNIKPLLLDVKDIPFFFHFLWRTLQILCTLPQRPIAGCHMSLLVYRTIEKALQKTFLWLTSRYERVAQSFGGGNHYFTRNDIFRLHEK